MDIKERTQYITKIKCLSGYVFAASFVLFSIHQIIWPYGCKTLVVTSVTSLICGKLIYNRTINYVKDEFKSKWKIILYGLASFFIEHDEYVMKIKKIEALGFQKEWSIFYSKLSYIVTGFFLTFVIACVTKKAKNYITELWRLTEKKERYIATGYFVLIIFIAGYLYATNPNWYLQFGNGLYSVDSGWIVAQLYPKMTYYDIRHPIIGILFAPIYSVLNGFISLIMPTNIIEVMSLFLMQAIFIFMLCLVGVMLRNMTNEIGVLYLWLASFPFMLYSFAPEKYQMCLFFFVIYLYAIQRNNHTGLYAYVISTGMLPTNIWTIIFQLFREGSLKEKIKGFFFLCVTGVATIVCLGRVQLLNINTLLREVDAMGMFRVRTYSVQEQLYSLINMIYCCIFPASSHVDDNFGMIWNNVTENAVPIVWIVFIVVVIGTLCSLKNNFYRVCFIYVIFAYILFGPLNWATYESPLFSILFSWAVIPLFVRGIAVVAPLFNIDASKFIKLLSIILLTMNIAMLLVMNDYLKGIVSEDCSLYDF